MDLQRKTQTRQTLEAIRDGSTQQRREFAFEIRSFDRDKRTVDLAFSSDAPVERWYGYEILSHAPGAVDMGRLQNKAALLLEHDRGKQIGVVESASIDTDGKGRSTVRFGKGALASEIFDDVSDGIRTKVSVGYFIREYEEGEDQAGMPGWIITRWEPFEISIVSCPADDTVGVGRGAGNHPAPAKTTQQQHQLEKRKMDNPQTNPPAPASLSPDTRQAAADAVSIERKRVSDLTAIGSQFQQFGGRDLAQEHILNGKSPEELRGALLERAGNAQDKLNPEIGMDAKDKRSYSVLKALRANAFGAKEARFLEDAAFEIECSRAADKQAGKESRGIRIPFDVLADQNFMRGQRDLNKGSATAGGNLVGTNLLAGDFISLLRNRAKVLALGATVLTGLVGNVAIPRQTAAGTAYWVAEGAAPTESALTVGQVQMSPKTIAANTDITRQLLLQSSVDVENLVRTDLATIIALGIDSAALYGTGSSNQPTGLKLTSGINTKDFAAAAPTWAEIVGMETEVASDNADVYDMAYLTTPTVYGGFKTTAKATNQAIFLLGDDSKVNTYRAERSGQVAAGDVFFGNWRDLMIGMWSGLDLMTNPYAQGKNGIIEITAFQDVDVAVRHAESFCRGNDTL